MKKFNHGFHGLTLIIFCHKEHTHASLIRIYAGQGGRREMKNPKS
jgi:hypothetical protein